MVLCPESIAYLHAHDLTCDLEWTCDLAEEIVAEASSPFVVTPPSQALTEDIHHTLSALRLADDVYQTESRAVPLVLGDTWQISATQLESFQKFYRTQRKWKNPSLVDEDWWDEGTFEPQIIPIMANFLLPRSSVRPRRLSRSYADPSEVERINVLDGQALLTTVPETEPAVKIPTPEALADIKIQLAKSQLEQIKGAVAGFSGFLQSHLVSTDELLESSEGVMGENFRHPISPPLIPRAPLRKSESWSTTTHNLVVSIRGSLQKEEIPESSPTLSNEIWNALDPFPRLSFSELSPESLLPQAPGTGSFREILSPELDLEHCNELRNTRNPLEPVLFARDDRLGSSKTRSTSFDPKQQFNSMAHLSEQNVSETEMLFDEPSRAKAQSGDEAPPLGLEGLVGIKGWDHEKFEREILGTPEDAVVASSRLKKLAVNLPEPLVTRPEARTADFFPPDIKAFTMGTASRENMFQDLRKVEGLRSLNIELSWTSYKFPQAMTIEQLAGLDQKEREAPWMTSTSDDGHSYISKRLKSEHNAQPTDDDWPVPFELLQHTPTSPLSGSESFGNCTPIEERPTSPLYSTTQAASRSERRASLPHDLRSPGKVHGIELPHDPNAIRSSSEIDVDSSRFMGEDLDPNPSASQATDRNKENFEEINAILQEMSEDSRAAGLESPQSEGLEPSSSNISTSFTPPSAYFGSRTARHNSANFEPTQKEISSLTNLTWTRGSSPIQDFSQEAPHDIQSTSHLSRDNESVNEPMRIEVSPAKASYARPLNNPKVQQNDSTRNQRKYTRKTLSDSLAEFLTTQMKGR